MQPSTTPNPSSIFTKKELRSIQQYNKKALFQEELKKEKYFDREYLIQAFIRREARNGNMIEERDMELRCFEKENGDDDLKRMMQIAKQNGAEYRKYKNWLAFEKFFKQNIE